MNKAEIADALRQQFQEAAIDAVSESMGIEVSHQDIEERGMISPHLNGWETFYFDGVELLSIGPVEMKFDVNGGQHSVTATRQYRNNYRLKQASN